jgi:hypothetical protein
MDAVDEAISRPARRTPIVRSYVLRIEAQPGAVFPLLCPVQAGRWLEGWAGSVELIWSASGVAEPGCVFRTSECGLPDAIWVITEHEPDRGVVGLVRILPGLTATVVRLEVGDSEDGSSGVAIRAVIVPTSDEGEAFAAQRFEPTELMGSVIWLERSLGHYLQTGRLLRRNPHDGRAREPRRGPRDETSRLPARARRSGVQRRITGRIER